MLHQVCDTSLNEYNRVVAMMSFGIFEGILCVQVWLFILLGENKSSTRVAIYHCIEESRPYYGGKGWENKNFTHYQTQYIHLQNITTQTSHIPLSYLLTHTYNNGRGNPKGFHILCPLPFFSLFFFPHLLHKRAHKFIATIHNIESCSSIMH